MESILKRAAAAAAALLFCALAVPASPLLAQEVTAGQPPAPVIVDSIAVRGHARLQEAVVIGESGLHVGDAVTWKEINRAIRRLWATGQFKDVKVSASEGSDPGRVKLTIEVEERPYVASINFDGLVHVSPGTVRDTAGLEAGGPYRPARVTAAEHLVRELLANEGFRARSVEHRLEPIQGRPGEYVLIIKVEEGQRVAISEIEFEGNDAFSDDQLRAVLESRPEGFFWFQKGTYDEEKLRRDLRQNLPDFYGKYGYIDFAVTGDSLVVDPESGKARLIISVDEGPQYRLADFEVRGNRRFATEDIKEYFERRTGGILSRFGLGGSEQRSEGEVFDREAFLAATDQVAQLYRTLGYLYARVEPEIERIRTEDGEPAVRLAVRITEGEPAYINQVLVRGNTYTHEEVIRDRIYVLPGDIYNEEALIQSYQAISGLGFFETPMPLPDIEQLENGDVNVVFNVKEKQTGSINFGTSIGGWGGLSGFLGYDQPNLFGQAKSGHLRLEYGRYANNFEASYTDPAIAGSRVSGSLSLFSTRYSYGGRFVSFDEGRQRRTGGALRFGVPFPLDPRWSRVFFGYSLSETKYDEAEGVQNSLFSLPDALQSTISVGLVRNRLNSPLFPTNGSRQEIEASFSGGLLGGDGSFQKYTASSSWWVPVGELGGDAPGSRPIRFALGLTAEAGAIFGDARLFPFERFWMGGVQFGESLRGYDETTITPGGYAPRDPNEPGYVRSAERFGDAFLRLSAEYAVRFNDNLSLSLFYDAGNVWNDARMINPTRLFRGAGVGLTLVTPFGPLGLDYAYGFDRDDPGWKFHFKFGQGF
ncbi:MAG TPA: outer membrane protein assembly factor BamA [Longimicrobiales bacterium]